jgi:hypothetical protein
MKCIINEIPKFTEQQMRHARAGHCCNCWTHCNVLLPIRRRRAKLAASRSTRRIEQHSACLAESSALHALCQHASQALDSLSLNFWGLSGAHRWRLSGATSLVTMITVVSGLHGVWSAWAQWSRICKHTVQFVPGKKWPELLASRCGLQPMHHSRQLLHQLLRSSINKHNKTTKTQYNNHANKHYNNNLNQQTHQHTSNKIKERKLKNKQWQINNQANMRNIGTNSS